MHVIYIFDSDGKYIIKYELNIDSSHFDFYTIVPIIYKDEKYYFILGYINSGQKAFLQYIILKGIIPITLNKYFQN